MLSFTVLSGHKIVLRCRNILKRYLYIILFTQFFMDWKIVDGTPIKKNLTCALARPKILRSPRRYIQGQGVLSIAGKQIRLFGRRALVFGTRSALYRVEKRNIWDCALWGRVHRRRDRKGDQNRER